MNVLAKRFNCRLNIGKEHLMEEVTINGICKNIML